MATATEELIVRIQADLKDFKKQMGVMSDTTEDVAKDSKSAFKSISDNAKKLGSVLVTVFAVDKILDWGKTLLQTTADIEALESQYEQVLKGMKKDSDKYLNAMADKYNKHPRELKSAMTQYVAILKGKGVAEKDAYELAKTMLERTVDANAFANEDMGDTIGRFVAMAKGEYDSLDSAMINLSATMLDTKAQETYGKKFAELTVTQQEQLKVQEAIRQHTSAGVFGQGVLEADSYNNNLAMIKNTWDEILLAFGSPLLESVNSKLGILAQVLKDFKAEGIRVALSNAIPKEFKDDLTVVYQFIDSLKKALSDGDWGKIGTTLGKGLGMAIENIKGLGGKVANKIAEEFNEVNWGKVVKSAKTGLINFSVALATMLNEELGTAMKNGDWSKVGSMLADIVVEAVDKITEKSKEIGTKIGNVMLEAVKAVDWYTLGENTLFFVLEFLLGIFDGLFNLELWWGFIKDNWAALLGALIGLLLAPVKILAAISKALSKIPLVGKFLQWIWDGFTKIIAPLSAKLDEWFTNLMKNFTNGWKRVFNGESVMGDWLKKIGDIWKAIIGWFTTKFDDFTTKTQTKFDVLGEKIAGFFKWIADTIGGFLLKATEKVGNFFTSVRDFAIKIKQKFGEMVTAIWLKIDEVRTKIGEIISKVQQWGREILTKLIGGISEKLGALSTKAGEIKTKVKGKIDELVNGAKGWAGSMITNFISGITANLQAVGTAASKIAGKVAEFIKPGSPTEEGPGRTLMNWGPDFVKTFADGLTNSKGLIDKASSQLLAGNPLMSAKSNINIGFNKPDMATALRHS